MSDTEAKARCEHEWRSAPAGQFCFRCGWDRYGETRARQLEADLAAARAELELALALHWEDVDDEWTEAIDTAHPTRGGSHENYATAMRMVGHRHSKGKLVSLVSWLLGFRAATAAAEAEVVRRIVGAAREHAERLQRMPAIPGGDLSAHCVAAGQVLAAFADDIERGNWKARGGTNG